MIFLINSDDETTFHRKLLPPRVHLLTYRTPTTTRIMRKKKKEIMEGCECVCNHWPPSFYFLFPGEGRGALSCVCPPHLCYIVWTFGRDSLYIPWELLSLSFLSCYPTTSTRLFTSFFCYSKATTVVVYTTYPRRLRNENARQVRLCKRPLHEPARLFRSNFFLFFFLKWKNLSMI